MWLGPIVEKIRSVKVHRVVQKLNKWLCPPKRIKANVKDERQRLPVAAQIRKGLEEAIRHAKGEITLKTTTLELPDRPPEVDASELIRLRHESGMSQAVFALLLNVSTKTVQSWEQGNRKPSQAVLRLIQVYRQNPNGLLELVGMSCPTETPGNEKPANQGDLRSNSGRGRETRAQRGGTFAERKSTLGAEHETRAQRSPRAVGRKAARS